MAKLIVGCGYLGRRVAQRWVEQEIVYALTRSAERAEQLAQLGLRPIIGDVTAAERLPELPEVETLLFAVGYDSTSSKSIGEVYAGGLKNVLTAASPATGRVIYISSTGVYGSADGDWVDERTPPDPQRAGGKASLLAEQQLAQHPLGRRSIILRLAGIYGPDRIPRSAQLLAAEPIPVPNDGYLNLIHVDDAAAIVVAAEQYSDVPDTFVVSDGHPVLRRDYYNELAAALSAPRPRFAPPEPGSPAALRAESSRRINNRKMMELLRPQLRYPSYREGLASIVAQSREQQ